MMSKKQKMKGKPDIRAMVNHLNALRIERTRVIGDMFSLPDSSESYQALQKRLQVATVSVGAPPFAKAV